MIDDSHQQANENQIRSLVQDFLQVEIKFNAMLPKKLAQLQNLLGETCIADESQHSINCNLFYRISYNLFKEGNMTMVELSHAIAVPFSTATRIVDWFVNHGYAQMLSDPEDRRVVRVALTDGGRDLYQTMERYMIQSFQQMLSLLTADEQTVFLMLMGKVVKALRETESQI